MKKQRNYVIEAYEKVGGKIQAAALMRVSLTTALAFERRGKIRLAQPALRLARASKIAVEKLAGMEDE